MKILLLTPQLPYPPHQGTSLRNYHIIRGLAARHDIHLLSFAEENGGSNRDVPERLRALCADVVAVPAPRRTMAQRLWRMVSRRRPDMAHRLESEAFVRALQTVLNGHRFDVVQVEGIELARYMPTVRRLSPGCKLVFDDHNAEAALQYSAFLADARRPRRWPAAAYSLVQTLRLRRFERWACRTADAVTVVSEPDGRALQRLAPGIEPTVIPNCIDVESYRQPPDSAVPRYDVVFTGKMDYRPNVDAVSWFGRKIWPLIRQVRPETTWAVVGQKPHRRLAWLRQESGVTVTGRVAEIQPYLTGARVYVMPLRMGSGTRLKMIEAMAAEKAIVSTPIGAEGYDVAPGHHLLLAETAAEFADSVLRLLGDDAERERLGASAARFAAVYDWREVIPRFDEVYQRLT
ncbi:MAG: glycosyltransferase [Candidatus Promineifilaceae bacterium]|nr:glycosyltransferase [Candidatus Promineifilaceae bacterium]